MTGPRDPGSALAGIAAATAVLEIVVLGLALLAVYGLGHHHLPGAAAWSMVAVVVLLVGSAGTQRRPYGPWLGLAAQVGAVACGVFVTALFVVGSVFLALWVAYLRMRRSVRLPAAAEPSRKDHP